MQKEEQLDSAVFFERQLAVFGQTALDKIRNLKVIIVNLNNVGIEIAKAVILSAPKKVTVIDDSFVDSVDRYKNWFFKEEFINKKKAQVYVPELQALHPFTEVTMETKSALEDSTVIKGTDVVILCGEYNLEYIKALNKRCHANRAGFILANSVGLQGHIFVDYSTLKIFDKYISGNNNNFYIRNITNEREGKVTLSMVHPHSWNDGDFVCISEVEGMNEVNGTEARPIKVIDQYNFTIENTLKYGKYKKGGLVSYVKVPTRVNFSTFEENLENPVFARKAENPLYSQLELHIATLLYYDLYEKRQKREPTYLDLTKLEHKLDSVILDLTETNEPVMNLFRNNTVENFKVVAALRDIIKYEGLNLVPLAKFVASIAAFQVFPSSGKFFPINQNVYFNFSNEYPQEFAAALFEDVRSPLETYYEKYAITNHNVRDSINLK